MSSQVEIRDAAIHVSGDMTLDAATRLLEQGRLASAEVPAVFDLGAVGEVDSSGLAVLFGWLRSAAACGKTLQIVNPPASLISLAEVYGVSDLLPLQQG
jgi:phospholipid transport system transporter-binding protein